MTKEELRGIVRHERRHLDPRWVAVRSRRIQERLLARDDFAAADVVCGYLALPAEVRTDYLIKRAHALHKTFGVPAYRLDEGDYGVARYTEQTELYQGPGGVWEPLQPEWLELDAVDLMVVPGLAFDRRGGRIGHGKGHYDRLLKAAAPRRFPAVGIGFEFQLFERVPVEAHDARLDAVITEQHSVEAQAVTHEEQRG